MNVLIIGGNGFIGSHLIDRLLANGDKVRVFDFSYEKYRDPLPNVDYRISRLDNIPDLYEALLGIDIVFHLASASVPSTSNIDHVTDINSNLIPSLHILNLMQRLEIKKIVYFSSGGAVYGNIDSDPINESAPLNPISSYGIIKVSIEHYIMLYHRLYNINYLIVRPSNPYGPRQGHFIAQGVISTFLKKALMNEPFPVYGDGSSTKDYIYIEDFTKILYGLIMKDAQGIFNIGSGSGIMLNSIIQNINKITHVDNAVVYTPQKSYDVKNFVLDMAKVEELIGPINFTNLNDGIVKTWDWIKSVS